MASTSLEASPSTVRPQDHARTRTHRQSAVYEPLQHRLAYAGSDGMTVSWSTFLQLKEPTVYCACRHSVRLHSADTLSASV